MKQRITIIIMLAGLVTMLAGCAENISVRKGELVQFTITAKDSPDTKTAYTDVITGEEGSDKKYERIDWVAGDKIRIISGKMDIVKAVYQQDPTERAYYDYTIASAQADGRYSRGFLTQPAEGEGLMWVNDPYGVTFYGSYPPVNFNSSEKVFGADNGDTNHPEANITMGIGSSQTATYDPKKNKKTVTEGQNSWTRKLMMPSMDNAYMICDGATFTEKEVNGNKTPRMNMDFYPVFNAFYIELKSEDGGTPIVIDKVSLSSTSDNLAGSFTYSVDNGVVQATTGVALNTEVGVDFATTTTTIAEADRTVKPAAGNDPEESVVTTLLTLSPTGSKIQGANNGSITNLTLEVTYHLQGQTQTNTAKLDLKKKGEDGQPDKWLEFPAFQKARILGLAMKGGENWVLDIYTGVNKWTVYNKKTSFTQQIGCDQWPDPDNPGKSLMVQGMWETGNHYADEQGTPSGHIGYEKYYQIRTLKDDHFIVKFRPYAPVGGYWRVTPWFLSGDTASPDKFEILVYEPGDTPGDGTYSSDLTGQIMGNWVELHIKPKNYDPQEDDGIYVMMLKCDFSTTKTFEEGTYFSADSEFQDVHGDGRYSYWRFTLDKNYNYTGGN